MTVKECVIERYLVDQVERKLKGEARKWTTRTHDPDRILLLPGGKTVFVEVKRPGAKPRDGQLREIARLNKMGFPAYWVSTREEVGVLINTLIEELYGSCANIV